MPFIHSSLRAAQQSLSRASRILETRDGNTQVGIDKYLFYNLYSPDQQTEVGWKTQFYIL
jgi:hypothetical protein